jgi:hypothetical protein
MPRQEMVRLRGGHGDAPHHQLLHGRLAHVVELGAERASK